MTSWAGLETMSAAEASNPWSQNAAAIVVLALSDTNF